VRCPICDLPLPPRTPCPNFWCGRPDRAFDLVWAIAAYAGAVREAIVALKYRGDRRQVRPLADLLATFLTTNAPCFDDIDLIVPAPGRPHVRRIVAAAGITQWPVQPAVTVARPTRRLTGTRTAEQRRLRAACELRPTLTVRATNSVHNRRVLVVDDVFTDGSTLRELAGALLGAGATAVEGLVIARTPSTRYPGW
jgi:predicted amidophosphoribosyltransferase